MARLAGHGKHLGAQAIDGLTRLFLPKRCPVTETPVGSGGAFSPQGWSQLAFLGTPECASCGLPFEAQPATGPLCAVCAAPERYPRNLCGPGKLDQIRSALAYNAVTGQLILALKYGDRHDLAPLLGQMLARALLRLDAPKDAALVPVPLHPKRLRTRRYNQAALLAAEAAKAAGIKVEPRLLRRKKATPQQKGLSFEERYRNLSGAFAARPCEGRAFILVDDVLTSGATLIGCAKALRRGGAAAVYAVTAARVVPGAGEGDMDLNAFETSPRLRKTR